MSFHYPYPNPVNKSNYEGKEDNLEAFYGLPKEIKFCKKCVISNQRPNSAIEFKNSSANQTKKTILITEDGICDACKAREIKSKVSCDKTYIDSETKELKREDAKEERRRASRKFIIMLQYEIIVYIWLLSLAEKR